ncbi:MAG: PAS domain S-box protein [Cyanobacteria bacterium P01_C01_bin.89]
MLSRSTSLPKIDLKLAVVPDPLVTSPSTPLVEAIAQMSRLRGTCPSSLRPQENIVENETEYKERQGDYLGDRLPQLHSDVRSSCVVVVDNHTVVGIVTERDIVRLSAAQTISSDITVGEVMMSPVITQHGEELTDLFFTVALLNQHHIRHLPIINDQEQLVGLVTHESLRHLCGSIDLLHLRTAGEVMTRQVVCASPRESLLAIAQTMGTHNVSCVMLAKQQESFKEPHKQIPVGLITERDLVQFQALGLAWDNHCAEDVMRTPVVSISPDDALGTVQDTMDQRRIQQVAVVGACGELLGIVTQSSLLQALNPLELYRLAAALEKQAAALEKRVTQLEQEKQQPAEPQQAETHQKLQQELRERHLAEVSLRESEQRYATLAAAVPVGIFRSDTQGQCTYVNDRWCQITELKPQQACGEQWQQVIHPEDHDRVLEDWFTAALAGQPLQLEFRYLTASGRTTWVYWQSVPEHNETGTVIGFVGTITDISDRKQAETALQNLITGTAATTGQDFFPALVTHMAATLNVSYAVVTALEDNNRLQTLAFWGNGQLQPPFSYPAPKTPCERTLEEGRFFCSRLLAEQFPQGPDGELDLVGMEAQSYLGVALHDSHGEKIGNLCVLDTNPIVDPERAEQLLTVFAARASAELERQRASTLLQGLNQELEAKVADRTATLREREEFLQTVLDTFPLSVFWKDRDCVIRGCNQEFIRVLGVKSSDDILGKSTLDLSMTPEEAAAYQADDLQIMASGQAELGVEESLTRPDGEVRWLETNKLPLRDGDGNVVGIVGTFQDITVRKEAELKLRAQAEQERLLSGITQRVRSSLNLSEILDVTVAELHHALGCDRVLVCRAFDHGEGSAIAESISPGSTTLISQVFPKDIFAPPTHRAYEEGQVFVLNDVHEEAHRLRPELQKFLKHIQVQGTVVVPVVQHQRLWGLLIAHQCYQPRQWKLREIKLLQQTADHIAIAIQQVHLFQQLQGELKERQQAQKQLTERNQQLAISNEQLARATRLKDEFLANMSHELRTPLNAILGMAEALQDEVLGAISPQQMKALNTIEGSGVHLLELINDILDVAKIEAGQIELHCDPTPIAPLCRSSFTFIRQQAKKKRIQVHLWIPSYLPYLMVDERRIRQVLINLLNNAVKFTPEGGTINLTVTRRFTPNIDTSTISHGTDRVGPPPTPLPPTQPGSHTEERINIDDNDAFLHIAIADTGIGISPDNITRLFQSFVQIDSALNRQYNGTGLGLALVKRIVELHGGQVGVLSEEGKGSCFMISLPCVITHPDIQAAAHATADLQDVQNDGDLNAASPIILLAEDNEANISTISSYLKAKGYQMVIARDGEEAIASALSHTPDLILMDIQMPGTDGLAAIETIREHTHLQHTPIVALTALAMEGDRNRCLKAGATEYLPKPVKLKQLVTVTQNLLKA